MRNAITVSALSLASVVMNNVTAAQTSAPQITITPTAAQNVITGFPMRFTGSVRSSAASYVTGQSISVDGGYVMR